jgi:hypothetical protein
MKHILVQLVALPISLLMNMFGQANAWYSNDPEPDFTKDIKRKMLITPILMVFNVLFIGVPAVVLAIDKWVFLYNSIALVAVIIVLMVFNKCFKFSNLSKSLYLLTSLWLTSLIIWATYSVNTGYYRDDPIIKAGYFDIISGVLIACNPISWVLVLFVISLACLIVFGLVGFVLSLLVSIFCCNADIIQAYLLAFALFCGGGCFDCFDKIIN